MFAFNLFKSTGEKSVDFKVVSNDREYVLLLSPLSKAIASATYKKKSDKFVLILKKVVEEEWYKLKETS